MTVGIWGAGLIGRTLASALVERGIPICVFNRSIERPLVVSGKPVPMRRMSFSASEAEMVECLEGLSMLVHCAGSADDDYEVFQEAAIRLARAAVTAKLTRVVLFSTVAVYGEAVPCDGLAPGVIVGTSLLPSPVTRYACSRYESELSMRAALGESGVGFTVVRIPMVLGAGMSATLFLRLRRLLDTGFFPQPGTVSASLPCIRVDRLACCLVGLLEQPSPVRPVYQFAEQLGWSDIVDLYVTKTGRMVRRVRIPGRALYRVFRGCGLARLATTLKSLMNEAVYADDSAVLLASETHQARALLVPIAQDVGLADVLWPSSDDANAY